MEIEKSELKCYNFLRNLILERYPNSPLYLKLIEYSNKVVKNIIENNLFLSQNYSMQGFNHQLTFDEKGNLIYGEYLIKGDHRFEEILNSREIYGYKAIVYKLKCKSDPFKNKVYFGFSKHNLDKRLESHILAAIGPHGYGADCDYVNFVKLHKAIIKVLESEGINIQKEYLWLKAKTYTIEYKTRIKFLIGLLERHFDIETIEIHKEAFTACSNEKEYTKNYVNDDGSIGTTENGLNEVLGGSNGQYIDLPLKDIAALISLGEKPKKIHKLVKKFYLIDVAYETLSERIRDIWESYPDAIELFLKPVVENLIKDVKNFQFNQICRAINRDRSNVRLYLKNWYKGRTFKILKELKKRGKLDWDNLNPYINNDITKLRGVSMDQWKKWLIQGVSCKKIGIKLGLSEETIRQTYKNISELGLPMEYRKKLRREIVKEFLAKHWDPKDIMIDKFKMKPKDNYCVRNFYERLFPELSYIEIIEKGKNKELYDLSNT